MTNKTKEEQTAILAEWASGPGMSRAEFAHKHGLTVNQFSYLQDKNRATPTSSRRNLEKQREYGRRSLAKRKAVLDSLGLPRGTKGPLALIKARTAGPAVQNGAAVPQPRSFCCPNCGHDLIKELEHRLMALRAAISLDL